MIADFVDHLLGGGASDLRVRAGAETLGRLHAHLDDALGLEVVSACASALATTKSQPSRPPEIMLLTALPPAPPTPNTVILGLSSLMSGIFRFMVMAASFRARTRGQACATRANLTHRRFAWPVRRRP